MDYTYLGKLKSAEELRALDAKALAAFCAEIRQELVDRVTENGGHLASNLGAVELTVAIHRVFDLPRDRLIFDVGHQSYVHKMLDERFARFDTLRKPGGISGFQRRDESVYDAFGGGHASTSLSAAIGFAEADLLSGETGRFTVAVVGDGAFSGGMIHEALNNCKDEMPLVIILNENEMSISKSTGHFAEVLAKFRSTKSYYWAKRQTKKVLSKTRFGKWIARVVTKQKMRVKRTLYADNYFEKMGIKYLGPVDGHDLKKLETVLNEAKQDGGCCLIHVRTVKGKGYEPAEKNPGAFHGIAPAGKKKVPTFSEHFGARLTELAEKDEKICAITAAMADGTGLCAFEKVFPRRFFDVGIAEEHAMTFAAGLSAAGMKPVYAVYSTFAQRCFDQMIHDAALQRIPVVLAIDRAGLANADGPTHHGVYDVMMALSLPRAEIFAPLTFEALDEQLDRALLSTGLTFIRYRSGGEAERADELPYVLREHYLRGSAAAQPDGVILTYGQLSMEALAAKDLAAQKGKNLTVLALEELRPNSELLDAVLTYCPQDVPILFAEEAVQNGGAGELWAETLRLKGRAVVVAAITDPFLLPSPGQTYLQKHGLSKKDLLSALFGDL